MNTEKIMDIMNKKTIPIIAGPCTISSYQSLYDTAYQMKDMGISMIRGGAFKLRTSIDSFKGLGIEGIEILHQVGKQLHMDTVSEVIATEHLSFMSEKIDILLVGTRSMHNYPLLEALGKISNPIILKRGMGSTIQEWLQAAEYIVQNGNKNVILCERGIRTFEPSTRFTLDISAIPIAHERCPYPIIVDPSHSSGDRNIIKSVSWAALAAGADGLLIEAELFPEEAVCDANQTINLDTLREIIASIHTFQTLWER